MSELVGMVRIGGEGEASPRHAAQDADARIALVDRELAELASRDAGGVRILEIDRSGDRFARVDGFRAGPAAPAADLVLEFLRIGVLGRVGAAEYVRHVPAVGSATIYATHNPHRLPTGQPRVPYDSCVPSFFPLDTVVSLEAIRRLAREYALYGQWPDDVPRLPHDDLVSIS